MEFTSIKECEEGMAVIGLETPLLELLGFRAPPAHFLVRNYFCPPRAPLPYPYQFYCHPRASERNSRGAEPLLDIRVNASPWYRVGDQCSPSVAATDPTAPFIGIHLHLILTPAIQSIQPPATLKPVCPHCPFQATWTSQCLSPCHPPFMGTKFAPCMAQTFGQCGPSICLTLNDARTLVLFIEDGDWKGPKSAVHVGEVWGRKGPERLP